MAKRKDPNERVRKIGERAEIIEVKLTQLDLEDMRMEVMVLLDDEERIEEKAKESAKNFGAQIKTNQLQRNELRRVIAAGKRRNTIIVEEHLTAANEVIRIRQDTGEQIGQRTATPRELQEEMSFSGPADAIEPDVVDGSAFGGEPS